MTSTMKKLFAASLLVLLSWQYGYSSELNISLSNAGDLINQVDLNTLDEVEKLTISGDINGTDVLVIRKMVNLREIDLSNANIVSGGMAYYDIYSTDNNAIGDYMFSGMNIQHIAIPESATHIKTYAFSECSNLTDISFPNKIYSIGDYAFYGCKAIKKISVPPSIKNIGFRTFYECENLTEVIIADNEESITMGTPFESCPIISLYIGRDIQYSGFYKAPFKDIATLKNVSLSDKVTYIGVSFFYGCSSLETIDIPNSVDRIFDSAFRGCESLKSVCLPNSLTTVLPYTFYGCSSLQAVKMPNSIMSIGNYAFTDCQSLTSVNLPDSLTSIGDYAFSGCSLTSINIPSNKTIKIGAKAFEGNKTTTISIPNNVTSIGDLAFANCNNLKDVILEDGENYLNFPVGSISFGEESDNVNCFSNCPLETLYIGRNLYGSKIWNTPTLTNVTIGESVTSLPRYAFENCTGLTSISLPSGITAISECAFWGCNNLKAIYLPENITAMYYGAFYGCESLTNITIPASVTVIGGRAFDGCHNLISVFSLAPTPPTITSDTFDEATEKNATLYVPIESKNLYMISPHWENFFNIEEIDLSSINGMQIDNDNTIQSVYSVNGMKFNDSDTSVLPKGVYIINGKKRLIK